MKARLLSTLVLLILALGMIPSAYAEYITARDIRHRIQATEMRIDRGVATGALTRREATNLKNELNRIKDMVRHMRDDGRLTPRERDRIDRALERLNRHISREKHDYDRRRY